MSWRSEDRQVKKPATSKLTRMEKIAGYLKIRPEKRTREQKSKIVEAYLPNAIKRARKILEEHELRGRTFTYEEKEKAIIAARGAMAKVAEEYPKRRRQFYGEYHRAINSAVAKALNLRIPRKQPRRTEYEKELLDYLTSSPEQKIKWRVEQGKSFLEWWQDLHAIPPLEKEWYEPNEAAKIMGIEGTSQVHRTAQQGKHFGVPFPCKKIGDKLLVSKEALENYWRVRKKVVSIEKIAEKTGINRLTLWHYLKKHKARIAGVHGFDSFDILKLAKAVSEAKKIKTAKEKGYTTASIAKAFGIDQQTAQKFVRRTFPGKYDNYPIYLLREDYERIKNLHELDEYGRNLGYTLEEVKRFKRLVGPYQEKISGIADAISAVKKRMILEKARLTPLEVSGEKYNQKFWGMSLGKLEQRCAGLRQMGVKDHEMKEFRGYLYGTDVPKKRIEEKLEKIRRQHEPVPTEAAKLELEKITRKTLDGKQLGELIRRSRTGDEAAYGKLRSLFSKEITGTARRVKQRYAQRAAFEDLEAYSEQGFWKATMEAKFADVGAFCNYIRKVCFGTTIDFVKADYPSRHTIPLKDER